VRKHGACVIRGESKNALARDLNRRRGRGGLANEGWWGAPRPSHVEKRVIE